MLHLTFIPRMDGKFWGRWLNEIKCLGTQVSLSLLLDLRIADLFNGVGGLMGDGGGPFCFWKVRNEHCLLNRNRLTRKKQQLVALDSFFGPMICGLDAQVVYADNAAYTGCS